MSQTADKTIIFSTSDERFRYAQYQPALVESSEVYDSRAAAEAGSDLARFIMSPNRWPVRNPCGWSRRGWWWVMPRAHGP